MFQTTNQVDFGAPRCDPPGRTAWEGLRIDAHVGQDLLGARPMDLAMIKNPPGGPGFTVKSHGNPGKKG